jgi:hypothetical protein
MKIAGSETPIFRRGRRRRRRRIPSVAERVGNEVNVNQNKPKVDCRFMIVSTTLSFSTGPERPKLYIYIYILKQGKNIK